LKVNIIGIILFITGVIIVINGVVGTYISISEFRSIDISGEPATYIDWTNFFMMASGPLTYGMVLIGVSEIIRILHKHHLHPTKNKVKENPDSADEIENTSERWAISEAVEEKIYELYSDKAILEIMPSQKEGYCIIKLQDKNGPLNPYIKIADVSGFGAREVHDETIRQEIIIWYENESYQKQVKY
jgi:hypothetical protein